ncbi:MAG TPA: GNAT family N-acetyltransferase [Acidobacteriaceae bacterium]|nr:GNAT family N-acetyltransferase [Acidobacteriaceae bacterium]
MHLTLQMATARDVSELVLFRTAVNRNLAHRFGEGFWVGRPTERGALAAMKRGSVFLGRFRGRIVASLTLSTRKPWAIDAQYFHRSVRPLYLTSMAVDPRMQGKGVGRRCLEQAQRIAREWPADAIRLDAWNAEAGAGEFYRKCGYREVGRALYRKTSLIYFELLL